MTTPSQGLICCKGCGKQAEPHTQRRFYCRECVKQMHVVYTRKYREKQKRTPKTVLCKGCDQQFDASQSRGRSWRCDACAAAYMKDYAGQYKQRHAQYSRNYRSRLGDEYRERMLKRRAQMIASMTPDELRVFRKRESEKTARLNAKTRREVYAAYGGKCACCGEATEAFLSIDHVNNDGAKMRRAGIHRAGAQFYQWLRLQGFPEGFQLLCMNCNVGKHRNGGVCPHQISQGVTTIPQGSRAKRPEAQRTR